MKPSELVFPGSLLSAGIFFLFSFMILSRIDPTVGNPLLYIPLSLAIFMIPVGLQRKIRLSRINDARKRVSDFLRDLSEYTMYGTPLSEAVMHVASNDYGYLNEDVRELVTSISVGTPVEEALRVFGSSLGDSQIERFGIILQKSGESGSNTSDVISLVARFSTQMHLLANERNAEMKNYNLVLMTAFAVFLFVMIIIDVRFFDAVNVSASAGFLFHSAGAGLLKKIFDTGIYVEAFGIGVIIGLVRDRNILSGFMETGAMLLASAIVLFVVGAL